MPAGCPCPPPWWRGPAPGACCARSTPFSRGSPWTGAEPPCGSRRSGRAGAWCGSTWRVATAPRAACWWRRTGIFSPPPPWGATPCRRTSAPCPCSAASCSPWSASPTGCAAAMGRCWSYAATALADHRRYDSRYGLAEALWLDEHGAFIGLDNNQLARLDGEDRPLVWHFAAPAGGWLDSASTPEPNHGGQPP